VSPDKAELKDRRSGIERDLLTAFKSAVPEQSRITVVADRGFGDIKLYENLNSLGFAYVIRFRSNITITSANGTTKPARDWLDGKRLRVLMPAMLTAKRFRVGRVLIVHDAAMKDCWCLAIKDHDLSVEAARRIYGERFSCEETFGDIKDVHFGMGLEWTRIGKPERRDRLMFLAALALARGRDHPRGIEVDEQRCGFDEGVRDAGGVGGSVGELGARTWHGRLPDWGGRGLSIRQDPARGRAHQGGIPGGPPLYPARAS
jgi:hypothetical protein